MVILSKAEYYIEYFFCCNTLRFHTLIKKNERMPLAYSFILQVCSENRHDNIDLDHKVMLLKKFMCNLQLSTIRLCRKAVKDESSILKLLLFHT